MDFKHKHNFVYRSGIKQSPLIVSGYGYTEYELMFCLDCGRIIWKLTKDIDNLYPKIFNKESK